MSFVSKRTLISMIAGVILVIGYIIYARGDSAPPSGDLKAWAIALLIFIGISLGAQVVILIAFYIIYTIGITIKEGDAGKADVGRIFSAETREDEREKLIELKSFRVGYVIFGAGAIVMLFALAFGVSATISLHILFGASALGALVEGIVRIVYSEKGISNA